MFFSRVQHRSPTLIDRHEHEDTRTLSRIDHSHSCPIESRAVQRCWSLIVVQDNSVTTTMTNGKSFVTFDVLILPEQLELIRTGTIGELVWCRSVGVHRFLIDVCSRHRCLLSILVDIVDIQSTERERNPFNRQIMSAHSSSSSRTSFESNSRQSR
jgi:hypothetical protein